jgi:preprotein translocase subunit SecE
MSDLVKTGKTRKLPNLGKYLMEIRSELKRVIWPTWGQVVKNTVTVLTICLLFGIIIWSADSLFTQIAKWVYNVTTIAQ